MRVLYLLVLVFPFAAFAAPPKTPVVPAVAQASTHFDAKAATDAWLATVPPAARSRSDAYFEGGYWLILWDFLYGAAIMLLVLETRLSAGMRTVAERLTRLPWLQSFFYWIEFVIV